MRMIFAAASLAALAACGQPETAPEPDATQEVAEAPMPLAADGAPTPGMYRITDSEGVVETEEVRADGTYSSMNEDGEVTDTGRWEQKDPATYCYTSDEEGSSQICNTEEVGEDGVWRTTNPDGDTAVVERIDT